MNKTMKFLVEKNDNCKRLDIFLSNKMDNLSRSFIKKLIVNKSVMLNETLSISPSTRVKTLDEIKVKTLAKTKKNNLIPFNVNLDIIFEDDDLVVVNKPEGMVVHPGAGNFEKTLVNALISKFKKNLSDVNGALRPGIVHRIDKDTSGLLVIAKNNYAHSKLGIQFNEHSIKRKYQCLIWGVIRPLNGKIQTLITRNKKNRKLMTVSETTGKKAITNYKTVKIFTIKDVPKISLIECELETGRTHQIRLHMKYKRVPILGDIQYGKKNIKFKKINSEFYKKLIVLKGQTLHAKTLEFIHPTKNKKVKFDSELPDSFKKLLNLLTKLSG